MFAGTGCLGIHACSYSSDGWHGGQQPFLFKFLFEFQNWNRIKLILLLIKARLSMPLQVQLHMNAVQQLLKICQSQGVYLADGIKRAIFWLAVLHSLQ